MPNTSRTQIPAEVSQFYDRTLLERAVALFVHTRWAQVRDIPRNAGTSTIAFRRYANLAAATTPLSEGITPTGSQLSATTVTATVEQYGDFVTITDKLDYESQDPILMEAAELQGDQAGDTLDQLTRDILTAGTSVSYGGSGHTQRSQVADNEILTTTLIDNAVLTLKNNNAKKITRMIDPSTGYATTPLNACYIGIVHPNVSVGFKNTTNFPNWVPVEKYPNKSDVMPGEIGSYGEVRFIETTNAKVFAGAGASGVDVYATIIFGMNAYGISRISGEAMKNIVKPLGSAGTADPLDQRATSGWKATFVAKILNNAFITRIETAI
jgi:N4-gp56 family major capsid protein